DLVDATSTLRRWQSMITGVLAGAAALIAAAVGWRGITETIGANRRDVEDQINAQRKLADELRVRHATAVAQVLATELMMLRSTAEAIGTVDLPFLPEVPGTLAKALVLEAGEIDGVLAACLLGHIVNIEALHRQYHAAGNASKIHAPSPGEGQRA